MTETRVYRGWLAEHDDGDATDILFVTGVKQPLAEAVNEDIDALGNRLSVRYFIADREMSADELNEDLINQIVGNVVSVYRSRYSEITGYLWTDEELKVGGHDLLAEFRSSLGKFLHLEIGYTP